MKPISLAFATLCLSLAVAQIHSPADAPTGPPNPPLDPMASGGPAIPPVPTAAPTDAVTDADSTTAAAAVPDTSVQPDAPSSPQAPVTAPQAPASTAAPAATTVTAAPVDTTAAPTDAPATTPQPTSLYPSIDEIMQLFNAIKDSDYFQGLSFDDQMLVLELASGGQAGKMNPILDNIGHERFLSFVYNIPFRYFDNLMQFTLGSLARERNLNAA